MSILRRGVQSSLGVVAKIRHREPPQSLETVDYESTWDNYARIWRHWNPELAYIGEEWDGKEAGAATSVAEYEDLIENRFIAPHIKESDDVLEIGVGGGRTAALLERHCRNLVCADISTEMLAATKQRLGTHLGYDILEKDTRSVPRDCVWIARAPEGPTVNGHHSAPGR